MKTLFLVPRLDKASTRYRVLQYLPALEQAGFSCVVQPLSGQRRQWFKLLTEIRTADVVFIQKKLFSTAELLLLRYFARRLIYDYDDSVMFKDGLASEAQHARQRRRFEATVRRADLVIAGNSYLQEQALPINPRVKTLPPPLDLQRYSERPGGMPSGHDKVILGWIGSRGTLKYLREITPALENLGKSMPNVALKIVADDFFDLQHMQIIKKRWSADTEIADLHSFDIGLMPLSDDVWTRGKCGFKLLQCMAVGLPVVCSPVGMNVEIVQDGVEGLWASTQEEWHDQLARLVLTEEGRLAMGQQARRKVERDYSLAVNALRLIDFLREA
ncbi:MAG: glycosyltransferase family 4 protein [Desulfuromonadales bacterium]